MPPSRRYCAPKGHDVWQTGRDSSGRCLACKREAGRSRRYLQIATERGIREAERARRQEEAQAEGHAAFTRQLAERELEQERKLLERIRRVGYDGQMAKWERASNEVIEKTGSRFGLCQWQDERPDGEFLPRMCYRRTSSVYCHLHTRESDKVKEER